MWRHFTRVSEEGKVNSHWGLGGGLSGGVRVPELHHVICAPRVRYAVGEGHREGHDSVILSSPNSMKIVKLTFDPALSPATCIGYLTLCHKAPPSSVA